MVASLKHEAGSMLNVAFFGDGLPMMRLDHCPYGGA